MAPRTGIIPARYGSTRFPGKPLALIGGVPMIERVYRQALQSELDEVVVATDDARILEVVEGFGGRAVMTDPAIGSGTERCREVVKTLGYTEGMVVNIQGDEPFIAPAEINRVLHLLEKADVGIATLVSPAQTVAEVTDPNRVKAVVGVDGRALYFSRQPIPYQRGAKGTIENHLAGYHIHIGIYGFATATLLALESLPEGQLEKAEQLEQLRWLEHGYSIYTAPTTVRAEAVDTPEDLEAIQKRYFL